MDLFTIVLPTGTENETNMERRDILPKDISDALKQFNKETKAGITNPETSRRLSEVLYKDQLGGNRGRTKTQRRRR
jgi:hypothetical protein